MVMVSGITCGLPIIDKKRMERKKLNLTFVDVAKAFDSVSHHSIIRAARRLDTPPLLTNYLTNLNRNCRVYMKMEKGLSEAISVGRGVRLQLPKDTTNAFLHASVRFGGLGLLQLRRWIPDVRIRRMTNVLQQVQQEIDSFLMDELQQNSTTMSEVRKFGKPQLKKEGGAELSGLRRLATLEQLHKTVDGYGLKSFVNAVVPSECLVDGVDRMPTHQFLQCTEVGAAVLYNRLRSAKRNPLANTTCDAGYEDVESLGHIVQNCPRTNGPLHARHDAIVRMLEARLKEKGYTTKLEPRIPTVLGTRIPDLCAWSKSEYIVCDVAVIKDTLGLDRIHKFKLNNYNKPDIHRWMKQNNPIADAGRQKGLITALILNWRGAVSWQSWSFWKEHESQEDFSCGCQSEYCRRHTRSGSSTSTAPGEDTDEETED